MTNMDALEALLIQILSEDEDGSSLEQICQIMTKYNMVLVPVRCTRDRKPCSLSYKCFVGGHIGKPTGKICGHLRIRRKESG
jgi:hypothetical protein